MQMKMSIFVLADTHNKFPEKLSILAKEADEIWHLGDVCAERILDELRCIGPPVTVVRGRPHHRGLDAGCVSHEDLGGARAV